FYIHEHNTPGWRYPASSSFFCLNLNDIYSDLCNIEYFKPNLYKKDSNRMLYEIDKFISEIN
ncbi:MAG: hypothetical protein E7H15_13075, partial [Lactococcus lactis]|nr:hypothetical protein [Lactococcus lactis]